MSLRISFVAQALALALVVSVPVERIQTTARKLLPSDTEQLTAAGADTVRGVIQSP